MTTHDCPETMTNPPKQTQMTANTQKWPLPPKNEPQPTTTTHHSPQMMASTQKWTQAMQTDDEGPGRR